MADLLECRVFDFVLVVGWEIGSGLAGKGPAGPGAPFALFDARFAKAIGVVLEVDAGVPFEDAVGDIRECV